METIATLFSRGKRRTAAAQKRLMAAHRRLWNGEGDKEDAEIVLVDLARYLGYFHTTDSSATTSALWEDNGKRKAFARIQMFTKLPPEALDRLASAVMMEDAASNEENEEL